MAVEITFPDYIHNAWVGAVSGDSTAGTDSLNEVLQLIAEIDEFKSAWVAIGRISRSLQLEPGRISS